MYLHIDAHLFSDWARPSHLKIPGGSRLAIDGPHVSKLAEINRPAGRRLFAVYRLGGPLMARTDPS